MLSNFVLKISGARQNWKPVDFVEKAVEEIRERVGDSKAIIALSGGVDFSVAAALAAKALGDRLVAIHVDHGFMRMRARESSRASTA